MKPRVQQTTDGGETAPVANKETLPVANKETLPVASKVNCYWLTTMANTWNLLSAANTWNLECSKYMKPRVQ